MAEAKDCQGHPQRLPSVDDSRPIEQGGVVARQGFNYQDEVAVGFLIELLEDSSLEKVQCETHDDIVLVYGNDGSLVKCAEFVQVKGGELNQLWTPAKLCERRGGRQGTSILEKSLEKDKHCEMSRFRIVSLRQVSAEMKVLTRKRGSSERQALATDTSALNRELNRHLPSLISQKNNGIDFWIENCFWDERQNEDAVKNENRVRLLKLSAQQGKPMLLEQVEGLLTELRTLAKDAAVARWDDGRANKVITKNQIVEWWNRRTTEIRESASLPTGGKLKSKMEDARLSSEIVSGALELRRKYAREIRTPRYMEPEESERLSARVQAEVQVLQSRLAAGQMAQDGVRFHSTCVDRMAEINREQPQGSQDRSAFLIGCLYDIVDRCLLRFQRPSQ